MASTSDIRGLLRHVGSYRGLLLLAVILMAVVGACEGLTALMIKPVIDRVLEPSAPGAPLELMRIPGGPAVNLNAFFPAGLQHVWTVFAISLLVIFLVKAVAEFSGTTLVQYVGHASVTALRNRVYEKLIRQPIGFFQHHPTGRVVSTVVNDVERIRGALSEWLADFFRQAFSLLFLLGVLLLKDWKLALGSLVFVPLVVIPVTRLGRRIRQSSQSSQARLGDLSQILQETIAGNRVVKAFGMEDFEIGKFRQTARRLLRDTMRWVVAYAATSPLMELLGAVVFALVVLYARDSIRHGTMTTGDFAVFVVALLQIYTPIKRLGGIYQLFQQAIGATSQVDYYLSLREEVADTRPDAPALPAFAREIVFDNVGFRYAEDAAAVLRNVSLRVQAGEVVAIVGPSGVGKSTLVNLLPRFHDVTCGSVLIDGHNVRDVSLHSLREQIAIVAQETVLFNDTVWNNICYGRPGLSEQQVHDAARAALAHDFISEMPQGYHTMLGERGQRLSGGQRQRIAIARALLKDSPILILDEATSELDAESERLVQSALANLMTGRTVFVIAHRLSTARRADRIVVLEDGTVREVGTHEQLLAGNGPYARLYELQFADAEPRAVSSETM